MNEKFQRLQIVQEVMIESSPEKVFSALVNDTKSWWGLPYISDVNCTDITVETKVGGRFFETWGKNEGRIWGTVTQIRQGQLLEVTGPFCMPGVVHAMIRFTPPEIFSSATRCLTS